LQVLSKLFNLALYQTGWFCCVLGAARDRPWLGAAAATVLILVHVALVRQAKREIGLLLAACLIGGVVDSLQSCFGLLRFESGYVVGCIAPPWILVMWMQFATLFRFGLAFLSGRYLLGAVLGALGGPFAFWVGERLGAVDFGAPAWRSLLVLGAVWAVATPTLLRLAGAARGAALQIGYRGLS
jgi:hypothetical protein